MAMDERFDATARKFHQWVVIALSLVAFVLGGTVGGVLMLFVGLVMVLGRFRDEADLFRGFYGAVLVPGGALVLAGAAVGLAWALVLAIALMVALDAALDFCVLCFFVHQLRPRAAA